MNLFATFDFPITFTCSATTLLSEKHVHVTLSMKTSAFSCANFRPRKKLSVIEMTFEGYQKWLNSKREEFQVAPNKSMKGLGWNFLIWVL